MASRREAVKLLKALSDDTRFQIIELLLKRQLCVCQIFPRVKKAQPTVSLHLKKLEKWGVIKKRREGKQIFYRLSDLRVCDVFKALGYKKGTASRKNAAWLNN